MSKIRASTGNSTDYIFVYGSLRKGTTERLSQLLAKHCEFISEGFLRGKLYEVNCYPGAIESTDANDRIIGDLYSTVANDTILQILDEYEACNDNYPEPHEYVRKKTSILLLNAERKKAWVYLYNLDISNLPQITSGDYLTYLNTG